MPDSRKYYYGVVIRKLLYTRRDRSRGIRDEATACEPEVVSSERTWPPRPVAQPSRATGRPFGTIYDNIDQNKAKKEGPGSARGQTGSSKMAATRFFDSATRTSYLTSNTSQCLSHTVTQFYSVNIKSRPKNNYFRFCKSTSGLTTTFFELRSISRLFGPFRALLKVLPVSELYSRTTDLDLMHPVFL